MKPPKNAEYVSQMMRDALTKAFRDILPISALEVFKMKLTLTGLRLDDEGKIWSEDRHIADCDLSSVKWKEGQRIIEATVKPMKPVEFIEIKIDLKET